MKEIKLIDEIPLVSIVVPVYNGERFLADTLQSLVTQELKSIEIIIVNDGSTDNTENVAKLFFWDRRIRYIKKENGGTGSALNVGHHAAKGKYITWCSADNIYLPSFARIFSEVLAQVPFQFVYSDFLYINEAGQQISAVQHTIPQPRHDLINGYDLGISFMYTKELWNKTGEYWNKICEDYEWAVRAAQYTEFCLVKIPLAAFRVHGGQLTSTKADIIKAANIEIKKKALELHGHIELQNITSGFSPKLVS